MKNIENNLPCIQDQNQEIIDDFNSYNNYNTSKRGIRRSEVRFLMGTQNFLFVPRSWQNEKTKHLSLVTILFDNVFSLWQYPLHGNKTLHRPIANNNRNWLYHQFVKSSLYKLPRGCKLWIFFLLLSLNIQKVLSFSQIAIAFFTFSYKTRFLGNFVKLTFESICLNSKHVLFGCRKQPLVCLLAIFRKNPPIWRTNGNKWSSDAYNMRQIK